MGGRHGPESVAGMPRNRWPAWVGIPSVSLAAVRDLLGHKDISVTTRYLSVLTEDKLKAVNLLSRRKNDNGS